MKRLIVKNIGLLAGIGQEGKLCLKGKEMTELNTLSDAYLIIEDGHFADYGKMSNCPSVSDMKKLLMPKREQFFLHGATPILTLSMQVVESKSLLTRFVDSAMQKLLNVVVVSLTRLTAFMN